MFKNRSNFALTQLDNIEEEFNIIKEHVRKNSIEWKTVLYSVHSRFDASSPPASVELNWNF